MSAFAKKEIREAMKILWDIDEEDVDQALDSLVKEGLVEVERLYDIECGGCGEMLWVEELPKPEFMKLCEISDGDMI